MCFGLPDIESITCILTQKNKYHTKITYLKLHTFEYV